MMPRRSENVERGTPQKKAEKMFSMRGYTILPLLFSLLRKHQDQRLAKSEGGNITRVLLLPACVLPRIFLPLGSRLHVYNTNLPKDGWESRCHLTNSSSLAKYDFLISPSMTEAQEDGSARALSLIDPGGASIVVEAFDVALCGEDEFVSPAEMLHCTTHKGDISPVLVSGEMWGMCQRARGH